METVAALKTASPGKEQYNRTFFHETDRQELADRKPPSYLIKYFLFRKIALLAK